VRITCICVAIAISTLLGIAPFASATIVLSDDFSNNGALVGSTPDVGGVWTLINSTTNPLTVSSTQLNMVSTGQDAGASFSAPVPHTDGSAIFTGLDIKLSAAQATGDYFVHLSDPALSPTLFYQKLSARSSGAGFQLGIAGQSNTSNYGTTVLSFGTTYHLAISWSFIAGALNDTFSVYVDPTSATEGSNTAYLAGVVWTGTAEPPNVSSGNFRQGNVSNSATLSVDNLIVATTFAEVAGVAIPEPTAFLFGGLVCGVIGLGVGARRLLAKQPTNDG
jgi:hypothetical protein